MAKYVPDVNTKRWVVIAAARTKRPDDAAYRQTAGCPFCPGNEKATPPEVYRIGPGEKDGPGWLVRVVPNLYPVTDIHEVIIHSPDDEKDIEDFSLEQVTKVLTAYRDRFRAHETNGQVMIFCNHGLHSGASLAHPHSQLAVVPKQINLDALSREPVANVIEENTYFVTYCPDFSQWPYEVWIAPKEKTGTFGETSGQELPDLASVLQKALLRIKSVFDRKIIRQVDDGPFVYNYYLYHGENWYIRIVPRFIHRAGFELGTGLNVNVVDPTDAAKTLKEISLS